MTALLIGVLGVDSKIIIDAIDNQTSKFIWNEIEHNQSYESSFTNEEILEALRKTAKVKSPISAPIYKQLVDNKLINGPGPQTVAKRFGSWRKACELAGVIFVEAARETYDYLWSKEEIILTLIDFLRDTNHSKSVTSYEEWRSTLSKKPASASHVRNVFESWTTSINSALRYMQEKSISPKLID
jgi:hypothetical protein